MPTLGTTTKPTSYWWSVATGVEQIAEEITVPAGLLILEVGVWVGGYNGTCRGRLCVWDADTHELLASSAQITVANAGGAGANVFNYTEAMAVPPRIRKGETVLVGFQRFQADGFTYFGGNTSGSHWEAQGGATVPDDFGAGSSPATVEVSRRIGAYVADYELIPGAKIYRSGVWTDAESVQVYRSGAWVDADAVQVYRSGAWVDSE